MFGKPKRPVVIVEIGNDWLKVAENSPSRRGMVVTKIRLLKLAQISGSVSSAIDQIFKDLKLSKQNVITYIPRHLVTVRILEFPSTNPIEIDNMVSLQVSKQTPYSKEGIVSAYTSIGSEREGYTKVMLVIARRSLIIERLDAMSSAGVEVNRVVMSTEGVYNWFNLACAGSVDWSRMRDVMLIDIDSNYSDIIVIRNGRLAFTRNIFIGANHLIEESDKWQDKFIDAVIRSMEVYRNEVKDLVEVGRIILSGAAVNIKKMDVVLHRKTGIAVDVVDPFRNIRVRDRADVLVQEFRCVSVCSLLGAAARYKRIALDLTPDEVKLHRRMEDKRKQVTIIGVLFSAIMMVSSLIVIMYFYNKRSYLAHLKQQIALTAPGADAVELMRKRIVFLRKRQDARGAAINLFVEIYKEIPDEIYLTNITIEAKKSVEIKGRALTMQSVVRFVDTLEASAYFQKVKTLYSKTKKVQGEEYTDFAIICMYQDID